ncbi:hypothetical protein TruAng_006630 [Truncatella angustata]|nr:hypothetical protein TruAng_006630 [Truncatella angustata]
MSDSRDLPDFDALPPVEGMPKGCAWGVLLTNKSSDRDGHKDKLGCLNLLTADTVKAAYAEARDGVTISLNASMNLLKVPGGPRAATGHKVLSWAEDVSPSACGHLKVLDDEVSFNTQASSQWDGLCHFAHQGTGLGYNGVRVTKAGLEDPDERGDLPGLEHWHKRGGVVGRGVLLDYLAYTRAKGITYEPFSRYAITIEDLENVAAFQKTDFRKGDILIVRAGVAEALEGLNGEEQLGLMIKGQGGMAGVEGSEDAAKVSHGFMHCSILDSVCIILTGNKWFWNKHFAAVAGDTFAFEVFPPQKPDGSLGDMGDLGLVASPPNALALF